MSDKAEGGRRRRRHKGGMFKGIKKALDALKGLKNEKAISSALHTGKAFANAFGKHDLGKSIQEYKDGAESLGFGRRRRKNKQHGGFFNPMDMMGLPMKMGMKMLGIGGGRRRKKMRGSGGFVDFINPMTSPLNPINMARGLFGFGRHGGKGLNMAGSGNQEYPNNDVMGSGLRLAGEGYHEGSGAQFGRIHRGHSRMVIH
jgi:hypothetical protein